MFRFLFRRPETAEDWHAHLRRNPNPQKMLICLSSDISLSGKRRILDAFLQACVHKSQKCESPQDPKKPAGRKHSELLWFESKLDEASHIETAQFIRFALYKEEDNEDDTNWCSRVIREDVKARWLVQREAYLNEEVQALRKSLSLLPPKADEAVSATAAAKAESKLRVYEKELRHLNNAYWTHKKHIWLLEAGTPVSAAGRAYETRRKHIPEWYLSEWLRRDCAGRGGCCGRECGCCEKARSNRDRKWNYGHCTGACGCCMRTKGCRKVVTDPEDDMYEFPDDCDVSEDCRERYVTRLVVAYIWGCEGFV